MTPKKKIKIYYKNKKYEEYITSFYRTIEGILFIEQVNEIVCIFLNKVKNYEIEIIKEGMK